MQDSETSGDLTAGSMVNSRAVSAASVGTTDSNDNVVTSSAPPPVPAVQLQSQFRCQGWNLAGANLLAASVWVAQSLYLHVRPQLGTGEAVWALAAAALVGALAPGLPPMVGTATGFLAGGFYLLWRVSRWRPASQIIQEALDRK